MWGSVPARLKTMLCGIKGINTYYDRISNLYDECKNGFGFNDMDTVLVLKDIIYQKYKEVKKKNR